MSVRKNLLGIYWKARDVIAPTLVYSQQIYEQVLEQYVTPETDWLDLGCGHQVLPGWRLEQERRLVGRSKSVVGIDSDMPSLRNHQTIGLLVAGDITRLPFADSAFDLVTANMVVEHLDAPSAQFAEVSRVLRPGGVFIFHTPNARGYFSLMRRLVPDRLNGRLVRLLDGRETKDVFPVQYKANTPKQIDRLAEAVGFSVVKRRMIVTDAVFSVVPPVMVFELMWIRALMSEPLKSWRTNIIAVLRREEGRGVAGRDEMQSREGRDEYAV